MKKAAWFGFICCLCIALVTGCQQAGQGAHEPNPQVNEAGGAREGEVQGRNYTSIYQYKNRNGTEQRIHSRIFSDLDLGATRDYDLGRTKTPGTRIARDQIPFGFADHRHTDGDVVYQGYGSNMYIDKQVLAEGISQMLVGLQDVTRASVLITDEECLIGYEGTGDKQQLFEQVWTAGLGMTPRWFHVYATDEPELLSKIRHLATNPEGHNMNVREMDSYVEVLIRDMKKEHPDYDSQGLNAHQKMGFRKRGVNGAETGTGTGGQGLGTGTAGHDRDATQRGHINR